MSGTTEILAALRKQHGHSIVQLGGEDYADTPRIPTGVFPFDLASGGGFPQGRVSIVYGPESSNKTNLALRAIAEGQRLYPDKKAVFIDVEHALDLKWARRMGVDTDALIVVHPEYAEQAVDITESFLYASDVFLVVMDSIAALTTQNEIDSSSEKMIVGGASLLVGKFFKKTTVSFNKMRNRGLMPPAFIAINQIRHKIGVMFGNPETMPGGNAPKFASSMTVRVYGKNVVDKKINATMPSFKEVNIIIQKWKVPILSINATYTMLMIDANGKTAGHVEDWNTISTYLKELDYLSKGEKAGWVMFGESFKTLDECKTRLYSDPDLLHDAKQTIITELLASGVIGEQSENVDEETGEITGG